MVLLVVNMVLLVVDIVLLVDDQVPVDDITRPLCRPRNQALPSSPSRSFSDTLVLLPLLGAGALILLLNYVLAFHRGDALSLLLGAEKQGRPS